MFVVFFISLSNCFNSSSFIFNSWIFCALIEFNSSIITLPALEFFSIKSISIIVEKIETRKGLPIQHLTGWNERSLSYLAKTLNLKIKYLNANDERYIFAVFEVWIFTL